MAIRWKLRKPLRDAGITNAYQLAEKAGIGYPAAVRIFHAMETDAKLGRFDLRTLDKVAAHLGVPPFSLLKHSRD